MGNLSVCLSVCLCLSQSITFLCNFQDISVYFQYIIDIPYIQMREKVGKVLVQSKPQVKAAPYIPTYYQVIPRIQCPTSIEVYQIVYIYNVLVSVYIDWHTCIDTCIDTMKSEWIFE